MFEEPIVAALAFQHNSVSVFATSPEPLSSEHGGIQKGVSKRRASLGAFPSSVCGGSSVPFCLAFVFFESSHALLLLIHFFSWLCSQFLLCWLWNLYSRRETIFPCDVSRDFWCWGYCLTESSGKPALFVCLHGIRTLTYVAKACFLCSPAGLVHAALQKASWTEWEK